MAARSNYPRFMIRTEQKIKALIAEKHEDAKTARNIATLVKMYEKQGEDTGNGPVVAAFDNHFGSKANDNSDQQLLIERQVLNELMRKQDLPTTFTSGTTAPAVLRLEESAGFCTGKLESHLKALEDKKHVHKQHKQAKCDQLHHLRASRPEKPHDFHHDHHARKKHCHAVHEHAAKEAALHTEIQQMGCAESLH
jgi:hypothetical protein